jgi:hypothetical protein
MPPFNVGKTSQILTRVIPLSLAGTQMIGAMLEISLMYRVCFA